MGKRGEHDRRSSWHVFVPIEMCSVLSCFVWGQLDSQRSCDLLRVPCCVLVEVWVDLEHGQGVRLGFEGVPVAKNHER